MTVKRQSILDDSGKPIAVLLPIEDYLLVKNVLEQKTSMDEKLAQMERAAKDPLFMRDLQETMADFAVTDKHFWESPE
jgi:hypothetical protein